MKKTKTNKRHQLFHCGLHCAVHNKKLKKEKRKKAKAHATG